MSCNRKCSSTHSKIFAAKAEKKSSLFCKNSSVVVAVTHNLDLHSYPQFGVYSNTMPEIMFLISILSYRKGEKKEFI